MNVEGRDIMIYLELCIDVIDHRFEMTLRGRPQMWPWGTDVRSTKELSSLFFL